MVINEKGRGIKRPSVIKNIGEVIKNRSLGTLNRIDGNVRKEGPQRRKDMR